MNDHHDAARGTPLWLKWALGLAQGAILMLLGWLGSQMIGIHDSIILNTYKIEQVQRSATMLEQLPSRVSRLEYRLDNVEGWQQKHDNKFDHAPASVRPR